MIEIREAVLEDYDEINTFDVFASDRKAEINRGEVMVAIIDGKFAGYMTHNRCFYLWPFIQFICVHEDCKRKGIAKALFKFAEDFYDKQGDEVIFASTEEDNKIMLNYFKHFGWEKSGEIENIQKQKEIVFVKRLKNAGKELKYIPRLYKLLSQEFVQETLSQ